MWHEAEPMHSVSEIFSPQRWRFVEIVKISSLRNSVLVHGVPRFHRGA